MPKTTITPSGKVRQPRPGDAPQWVNPNELPRPAAGAGTREAPRAEGSAEGSVSAASERTPVPLPASGIGKPEPLVTVHEQASERDEDQWVEEDGETVDLATVPKGLRTRAKMTTHQKHAMAQAMVNGLPVGEIAQMVRHTPAYVKQLIQEDEELHELVGHWSNVAMRATVAHRFEMLDRLDAAYRALDDALLDNDIKVRLQAAKEIFGHADKGAYRAGPQVEINMPLDPSASREIREVTSGITELLTKIADGELVAPPLSKHMRGDGDLPGPEAVVGHSGHSRRQ